MMRPGRTGALSILVLLLAVGVGAAQQPGESLIAATRAGDAAAVRALLDAGVEVDAPEPDGTTALHRAVHRDDPAIVELLIGAGADVDLTNDYGVTPLSLACTNGSAEAVARLLDAGADPEVRTEGETALMTAVRTGSVDVVKLLIAHGADLGATELASGQTLLMTAAAEMHPSLVRLLLARGADVHARSVVGFTPLLFAVRAGDLESVRLLIGAGASANERFPAVGGVPGAPPAADDDEDGAPRGTTALVLAIGNAHYELADYLLEQGADPNADSEGQTALHALVSTMNWEGLTGPDPEVVGTGGLDARDLLAVLLAAGADVNAGLTQALGGGIITGFSVEPQAMLGVTAFWQAARAGDIRTMRVLADHGADLHHATERGTTPLMVAAGVGFTDGATPGSEADALEAVRFLVEQGADVHHRQGTDPDCTPRNYTGGGGSRNLPGLVCGWTALHGAAVRGADSIVQFLVDQGARLDVRDKAGQRPLEVAEFTSLNATSYVRESTARLLRRLMIERNLLPAQ
ncbi:MAG: ankyrin repeat domain-containing protein [Acidobacteria bacterium]|nr:ankyrin repeat domain-containing protein [Acidobacteriota bacterium]